MSGRTRLPFGKFFWSDYASDPNLKVCSLAAQGLWMRMLCIAAAHEPPGYIAVNGQPCDDTMLARLVGAALDEVVGLREELERNGVPARDRRGWLYSRRMIRDAKTRDKARQNGKKGGNPKLRNNTENPEGVKGRVKQKANPHIPEASSDTKVSAADAPSDDDRKRVYDLAKAMLVREGTSPSAAGGIVTNLLKKHSPASVLALLPAAENAAHPLSYLTGALNRAASTAASDLAALYDVADSYAPTPAH